MSKIEGNLSEVLSCVEIMVRNIKHKRDLILKGIANKKCVSNKQLSDLLNTFVNQILDNFDKTSDEELTKSLSEEPHKQLSADITAGNLLETQLRQQIKSLEDSLQKETEDKQRIQSHCAKIMNNCQTNEENHKKCVEELNQIIENYKKSESELKLKITDLENNSSVEPKFDPMIVVKREIKREALIRAKSEEPLNSELNGDKNESEDNISDSESEDNSSGTQELKKKCLASKLSISLERFNGFVESNKEEVVVHQMESSDGESVVDLTPYTSKLRNKSNRVQYFVKRGRKYVCKTLNCEYSTTSKYLIRQHIISCSPFNPSHFDCHECTKSFLTVFGLRRHIAIKHNCKTTPPLDVETSPVKHNLRSMRRLSYA